MTAATGSELGGPTAETLARSAEVLAWLVEGLGRPEIHARARERWDLAPRSADRLIAFARGQLREAWSVQREELMALLLSRCDRIFRRRWPPGTSGRPERPQYLRPRCAAVRQLPET
jgi:hypothetical protein